MQPARAYRQRGQKQDQVEQDRYDAAATIGIRPQQNPVADPQNDPGEEANPDYSTRRCFMQALMV